MHETQVPVPTHAARQEAKRRPVLLGKPARGLPEAPLFLPPRQTQRPLPGSGQRPSPDVQPEDHNQQEQDRRARPPDLAGDRQGRGGRGFEAGSGFRRG